MQNLFKLINIRKNIRSMFKSTKPRSINIKDKYISKHVVWKPSSIIQKEYIRKTPERFNCQQRARQEFLDRVAAGTFKFVLRECVICGGREFFKIADCERMGLYFPTSICGGCGLVQANPVLRQNDYDEFYRFLYREMFSGRHKITQDILRETANTRGARLFAYLEKVGVLQRIDKEKDLIVEVGCGDGSILSYFHDQGYRIIGIDVDEEYMKLAKNLGYDLRCSSLRDISELEKPKLIYYNHSLEHIMDINSHLDELSECISESGVVVIVVPGVRNIHKAYRGDLLHYLQVAHVFNFSLSTLEMLMARHGFAIESGDEGIRAVFRKRNNCKQITLGRAECLSVMHYFRNLEREMHSRMSQQADAG